MGRFINFPVDVQIGWPNNQLAVSFGPWEIIVFPPSAEHEASLHLDLIGAKLSDVGAMTVLNQFLSIGAWLDDTYAVLRSGWSGNPVPSRPIRRTSNWPSSILDVWPNAWSPIADKSARRALAIYREAVNMQYFHSQPYAALGFYKILESAYPDGLRRAKKLEEQIDMLIVNGEIEPYRLQTINMEQTKSPEKIASFLYRMGRQAVAHANKNPTIDPDDIGQQRQMSVAASILRTVAR